uniref:Uncharacterized protein n=1 Tax=Clytia hemisphaerica TaxID=252671 RepID=A0A7M5XID3_9CNID
MGIKVLILFTAVLAIAYSYRISNDNSNIGRNFYRALKDMIGERVTEKMDPANDECTFGGLCTKDYSFGCHKYVKKCTDKGFKEIGTCWRQCYSNSKTWCRLADTSRRDQFFSCEKDSDCAYTGGLGKPAKEACELFNSEPMCLESNP